MKFFWVLIFLPALMPVPVQQKAWELKKEADGIRVYTRESGHGNLKEFKATAEINRPLPEVLAILRDVPRYPEWIEDVAAARLLHDYGDSLDFYYELKLPWPLKNRDIAMRMVPEYRADGTVALHLTSQPRMVPETSNFVRMHRVAGSWLLEPAGTDRCRVTYQFLADPEGMLPAWVVNLFIVDGPYKTLKNLAGYPRK